MKIVQIEKKQKEIPICLNSARELLMDISRPTLRKLIRAGKIRSHRFGREYFFFETELIEDLKKL